MAISNIAIGSTNTEIYTSSGNNAITTVIVCNTATFDPNNPLTGQTNLYLYAVPSADVSGTTTQSKHTIVNGLPIPAGETVMFDQEKMVLANGDKIFAKSDSPANLVVTVSSLAV
jgi:hypothetical protein